MNLEDIKKKFESGEYILITDNRGFWEKAPTYPALIHWSCNHKAIHKRHKDVLDAYLEDNSVEIMYRNFNFSQFDDLLDNFINTYNEDIEYKLKQPKPKNNFKDYGFEADFEGEILKKTNDFHYLGYIIIDGCFYSCQWDRLGNIWDIENKIGSKKHSLVPLKKEWYLDIRNDGKLIKLKSTTEIGIFLKYDGNFVHCGLLNGKVKTYVPSEFIFVTKEDMLPLLIKE